MHYFNVEQKYTRKDIRKLLGFPESEKNGSICSVDYVHHGEDFYFC